MRCALVLCCLLPVATLAEQGPAGTVKSPVNLTGDILIGQGINNRVMIAVDTAPTDGLLNYCLDFVPDEPFQGERWVRFLSGAKLKLYEGRLTVKAGDHSFAASLSVEGTKPQNLGSSFAETYVLDNGISVGIFSPAPGSPPKSISTMNHDDVTTWPESFWYDYHDPRSRTCGWPTEQVEGFGNGTQASCQHPTFPDTLTPKNCEATCDDGTKAESCGSGRLCCCGCGPSFVNPTIDVVRHKCVACSFGHK